MNKTGEMRIALFGQSTSGKTTLLASYFGNQQRDDFKKKYGYSLAVEDVSMRNKLLSRYYQMEGDNRGKDGGKFPLGTKSFERHDFNFMLHELREPGLKIVWYDYPGGWWENTPENLEEERCRRKAFGNLLQSHVGILLVDGVQYNDKGIEYVKLLLNQFSSEIEGIKNFLGNEGNSIKEDTFPKQWIIAISKADVLPKGMTAEDISKKFVSHAADQLNGLREAVNSEDFGSQYMLISSASCEGRKVINVHQYIGFQLIAPVVLLSVLAELAKKTSRGRVSGTFKGIFEGLKGLVGFIDKIDDFLPKKYQLITHLLKVINLQEGLEKGVGFFRKKQEIAAQKGKIKDAVINAMKAELASDEAQRVFFRNH